MREKCETVSPTEFLGRIVSGLLGPLKQRTPFPIQSGAPRAADPLWQIGHAAFDAERALVIPPVPQEHMGASLGENFHGRNAADPWDSGRRPQFSEVETWWKFVLLAGEQTLSRYPMDMRFAEPIEFTACTVRTLEEAFNYALYHTAFHLGRAWEIAEIP